MFVIRHRKIFYIFTGLTIALSLGALWLWGLNFGIDFTGGSILEIKYSDSRPDIMELQQKILEAGFAGAFLQPTDEAGILVRLSDITEEKHQELLEVLAGNTAKSGIEELHFDSVGPIIGQELKRKSLIAIFLVLIMILAFISWSFRNVSRPVASWKYGLIAIIALAHDILIPAGFFAVLGEFMHAEVGTLFVTALLTLLGFSVYDTIVVFDRIRENIQRFGKTMEFEEVVGKSLSEVMGRSLATSLVLFLVLFGLFILGESSIKYFILTLLIGVVAGAYSSIFVASPLLVSWESFSRKFRRR